tara:strand:+ start:303 stop:827 length:525 start_codon:yes stop_codon:yes gene_type:complete
MRYRESFLWDTLTHTDPVAAGDEFRYFVSTTSKNRFQQNFDNERRLPQGASMLIHSVRVGFPDQGVTPADATLIQIGCWVQVLVDDIPQMEAPIWALPQGGGMCHYTPEDAGTTDQLSNGVPTADAVHRRRTPIEVTSDNTYEVIMRYGAAANMSASVVVQCLLEVQYVEEVRA